MRKLKKKKKKQHSNPFLFSNTHVAQPTPAVHHSERKTTNMAAAGTSLIKWDKANLTNFARMM